MDGRALARSPVGGALRGVAGPDRPETGVFHRSVAGANPDASVDASFRFNATSAEGGLARAGIEVAW